MSRKMMRYRVGFQTLTGIVIVTTMLGDNVVNIFQVPPRLKTYIQDSISQNSIFGGGNSDIKSSESRDNSIGSGNDDASASAK